MILLSAVTVIVGATLVDGGGRAPVADSVIVVRGGVIAAVGDRVHTPIPKGASLIDGRAGHGRSPRLRRPGFPIPTRS